MKNFAIVGLGRFGQCMLESLMSRKCHVVVIDRDEEKIQHVRDIATQAIKADALNREVFEELFPDGVDCAIIDLGDQMQASILVTNYLSKMKVPQIVAEASNAEHAEILKIVGATRIVIPEEEAAERLAGILVGQGVLEFFAVSEDFSMVEIPVPEAWVEKSVTELDLRKSCRVTVVAVRSKVAPGEPLDWRFPEPDLKFDGNEFVLIAGSPKELGRLQ